MSPSRLTSMSAFRSSCQPSHRETIDLNLDNFDFFLDVNVDGLSKGLGDEGFSFWHLEGKDFEPGWSWGEGGFEPKGLGLASAGLAGQKDCAAGDFVVFDHLEDHTGGYASSSMPDHVVETTFNSREESRPRPHMWECVPTCSMWVKLQLSKFQLSHCRNEKDGGREKEGYGVCLGFWRFGLWRVRICILTRECETVARGAHSNIKNSIKYTKTVLQNHLRMTTF